MRVAVIGTGLIGGSIGLALKARTDAEVVAFDRDPAAAARAVERGAADRAAGTPADAAVGADFVFIATPVGAIAESARVIAESVSDGAIVTDVGSTKSRVVVEVDKVLRQGSAFIGGHPMAGTEQEGIEAASSTMFEGAWWILTPTEGSDADTREQVMERTAALIRTILERNGIGHEDLVSLIFTATDDVRSEFPAAAARGIGISDVPLLCARELDVEGAVPLCIRVLIHLYTEKEPSALRHVYLEGATPLRTDLPQ